MEEFCFVKFNLLLYPVVVYRGENILLRINKIQREITFYEYFYLSKQDNVFFKRKYTNMTFINENQNHKGYPDIRKFRLPKVINPYYTWNIAGQPVKKIEKRWPIMRFNCTWSIFPNGRVWEALRAAPELFSRLPTLLHPDHLAQLLQLLQQERHCVLAQLVASVSGIV